MQTTNIANCRFEVLAGEKIPQNSYSYSLFADKRDFQPAIYIPDYIEVASKVGGSPMSELIVNCFLQSLNEIQQCATTSQLVVDNILIVREDCTDYKGWKHIV